MNWISSDWHLNHPNISGKKVSKWESGYRTFNSVPEMNDEIIKNLNKYVKWDDTLWFIGDFCFGGHHLTPKWRDMINCQTIHWILGNHDEHAYLYKDKFTSIQDYKEVTIDGHRFILFHYALRVWNHNNKGVMHCYGHSHSHLENEIWGRSIDTGIDNAYRLFGEYRPFSVLNDIIPILEKRPIKAVDHHTLNNIR